MASFKIENGVLKINDNYRAIIYFVLFVSIVRLVSMVILFSNKSFHELNFEHFVFIFLGTGFIVFSVWVGFTQSFKNEFVLKDILKLQPYGFKSAKRYHLYLKNGRKRDVVLNQGDAKLLAELVQSDSIKAKSH